MLTCAELQVLGLKVMSNLGNGGDERHLRGGNCNVFGRARIMRRG